MKMEKMSFESVPTVTDRHQFVSEPKCVCLALKNLITIF